MSRFDLCKRCKWFKPTVSQVRVTQNTKVYYGECHKHPPVIVSTIGKDEIENESRWPEVWEDDFCGEYEPC